MTRRHLTYVLRSVAIVYFAAILAGIAIRLFFPKPDNIVYETYKDLLPLIIALPATYLAAGFQRRNSYMQALRGVWSHLVEGIAGAMTYTELESPTEEHYAATLRRLSAGIEEVRGVFKNIPVEGKPDGYFPFEPVRQIYFEIQDLGFGGKASRQERLAARERIYKMWKANRAQLLAEFERDKPTHHHADYVFPPRQKRAGLLL